MTALLVLVAVLVAGLVAWHFIRNSRTANVAQTLGALNIDPATQADQPCTALPWVAQLTTSTAGRGVPSTGELGAGDWYDPTATSYAQTFNEFGFITSPSPAPVDPRSGRVPLTNADVCAWVGHLAGDPCPRCGVPNP